jgi:hypothetical protein
MPKDQVEGALMAYLEATEKDSWKTALRASNAPWVAFGLNGQTLSRAERLGGMAGLIDWHLHGQVSKLLADERLADEEFCLLPGPAADSTSFLLYQHGASPNTASFLSRLKQLNISEICLAETTFPGDFLAKLKQNLKKEGIRCTKLEPGDS